MTEKRGAAETRFQLRWNGGCIAPQRVRAATTLATAIAANTKPLHTS